MAKIPKKVVPRIISGIKLFQPIILSAKARDINEADTAMIVIEILSEILGYNKFTEIASEHSIHNTYCDLAIKIDGDVKLVVEIKAIGLELKDNHVKQAIDYATNAGTDWVILTNGIIWRVYKVIFSKPVDKELIVEIDFTTLNHKNEAHINILFALTKEGWKNHAIGEFHATKRALDRFSVAAAILCEPTLKLIRKRLLQISPDVKVDIEQIQTVLLNEVLKREVLEGEKAKEAQKRIAKIQNNILKAKTFKNSKESSDEIPIESQPQDLTV